MKRTDYRGIQEDPGVGDRIALYLDCSGVGMTIGVCQNSQYYTPKRVHCAGGKSYLNKPGGKKEWSGLG